MPVELAYSRTYPVGVARAYDAVLPAPLPALFSRRYAVLPAIREVRDQAGEWGTLGQTRTIVLADRGTMRETLVSLERPDSFGYEISDVRGPMKPLASRIEGRWTLREGRHRGPDHLGLDGPPDLGRDQPADAGLRPDVAGLRASGVRRDRADLLVDPESTPTRSRFGGRVGLVLTFPTASPGTHWGCGAVGSASRSQ